LASLCRVDKFGLSKDFHGFIEWFRLLRFETRFWKCLGVNPGLKNLRGEFVVRSPGFEPGIISLEG
jgi:hypothetical protein